VYSFSLRAATSWQRVYCETCREDTNHHKNACVHCGSHPTLKTVTVTAQYNDREMVGRLNEIQRAEARRLLNSGMPPKLVAMKLHVSQSTVYRLNPLTRG
jgi:hypothetical protein